MKVANYKDILVFTAVLLRNTGNNARYRSRFDIVYSEIPLVQDFLKTNFK